MIDKIYGFFDWVVSYLSNAMQWIYDVILNAPELLFSMLTESASDFLRWIPVPSFMHMAASFMHGIPPSVTWFLSVTMFNEGLAMVFAAYTLRFIIRRIPFIG